MALHTSLDYRDFARSDSRRGESHRVFKEQCKYIDGSSRIDLDSMFSEIAKIVDSEINRVEEEKRKRVNFDLKKMILCGKINSALTDPKYKVESAADYLRITDESSSDLCYIFPIGNCDKVSIRVFRYLNITINADEIEKFIKDAEPMFKYYGK
mgnify:FL=1